MKSLAYCFNKQHHKRWSSSQIPRKRSVDNTRPISIFFKDYSINPIESIQYSSRPSDYTAVNTDPCHISCRLTNLFLWVSFTLNTLHLTQMLTAGELSAISDLDERVIGMRGVRSA